MAVGSEEGEGEGSEEGEDQVGSEVTLGSYLLPVLASRGPELAAGRQPALASRRRFEVTSRDRLFLQLAKLPERYHATTRGRARRRLADPLCSTHLPARARE